MDLRGFFIWQIPHHRNNVIAFHKVVVLLLENLVLKVKWNCLHHVLKVVACIVLQVLLVILLLLNQANIKA